MTSNQEERSEEATDQGEGNHVVSHGLALFTSFSLPYHPRFPRRLVVTVRKQGAGKGRRMQRDGMD